MWVNKKKKEKEQLLKDIKELKAGQKDLYQKIEKLSEIIYDNKYRVDFLMNYPERYCYEIERSIDIYHPQQYINFSWAYEKLRSRTICFFDLDVEIIQCLVEKDPVLPTYNFYVIYKQHNTMFQNEYKINMKSGDVVLTSIDKFNN